MGHTMGGCLAMDKQRDGSVGPRIRTLRTRKGMSMRALADASGLSINTISKIEREESSPTVLSLRRIANALEVPVISLFRDEAEETTIFVKHDRRPRTLTSGAIIETLGTGLPNQCLEPLLMLIEPGAGNTADTYTHSGEEFVYCIDGEVEYRVDDRIYRMEAGDSLLFEPDQPHAFHNSTDTQAMLLIVIQEQDPDNRRIAQQAHAQI